MATPIATNLDDPTGSFVEAGVQEFDTIAPYDSEANFLVEDGQRHVDLRTFQNTTIIRRRLQNELNLLTMESIEGVSVADIDDSMYDTQTELEGTTSVAGENWTHTLVNGLTGMVVAPLSSRGGWRGLKARTDGTAIDDTFTSSIEVDSAFAATDAKDISAMGFISIVFPDGITMFDTDSDVQLTSNPDGTFGTAAYNSDVVPFSASSGTTTHLKLSLGDFDTGSGVSYTDSAITGVRIHLRKDVAPAADLPVTIMAIRAITSDWVYREADFDTQIGAMGIPVTLAGTAPTNAEDVRAIPLLRGSGSLDDPKPVDGSLLLYFSTGNVGSHFETFDHDDEPLSRFTDAYASGTDYVLKDGLVISGGAITLDSADASDWYEIMADDTWITETGQATVGFKVGARGTLSDVFYVGSAIKFVDEDNYMLGTVIDDGTDTKLRITTRVGGVTTTSTSAALASDLVVGNTYYVRTRLTSTDTYVELFTSDPASEGSTPVATRNVTTPIEIRYASGPATIKALPISVATEITSFKVESVSHGSTDYNEVNLYFREVRSAPDASWIRTGLRWNATEAIFDARRDDYDGSDVTSEGIHSTTLPLPLHSASYTDPDRGRYALKVNMTGTTMLVELYETDAALSLGALIWTTEYIDSDFTTRAGRVGFGFDFSQYRDAFVDLLSSASVGYGTLRSKVFVSHTPVDGARLSASYSVDENLFRTFDWINPVEQYVDQTKTVSGFGSFRTTRGLYSNQFLVESWEHIYIDMQIWVPASVTERNQPDAYLVGSGGAHQIEIASLQPNQWNPVHIDLFHLADKPTGLFYQLVLKPREDDPNIAPWYTDSVKVGKRTVAWQLRAQQHGQWRDFYDAVNREDNALHLGRNERGTELQLQVVALSPDAWVAEYTLHPHYAELGAPVFDKAYETRA